MQKADLKQNIEYTIERFKKEVNPQFKVTKRDLDNIIKLLNETNNGWSGRCGSDLLYKYVDMDVLKYNNVKDFSFTVSEYEKWLDEEWDRLKQACIEKRNKLRRIN